MTYQAHHDDTRTRAGALGKGVPPPGGAEPVLYYTTRPFRWSLAAQTLPMLIVAPMVFVAPETALVIVGTALVMAWWACRTFVFELTPRHLRYRPGPFMDVQQVSLWSVESVQPMDIRGVTLSWGKRADAGHLRVRLSGGEEFVVAGMNEPVETADAVVELKRRLAESTAGRSVEDEAD